MNMIATILTMSIAGGMTALLLFALKPLVKEYLPKSVQYYLWLVVIATLLVPGSIFIKLPTTAITPIISAPSNLVDRYIYAAEENTRPSQSLPEAQEGAKAPSMPDGGTIHSPLYIVRGLVLVYPLGVIAVLLYYCFHYFTFKKLLRCRNRAARPDELQLMNRLNERAPVLRLYRNPLASTPMLIGLFYPEVILPDREYTEPQLHAVLLHELTHKRRHDLLVKWLSVIACAIHWFNPLAWLVRREIDRACELSCDEAVIHNLDQEGKQNYGDTILLVAAASRKPRAFISTTMGPMGTMGTTGTGKKLLKERLSAIMKGTKTTRLTLVLSIGLIVAVLGVAVALATGSAKSSDLIEDGLAENELMENEVVGNKALEDNPIGNEALEDNPIGNETILNGTMGNKSTGNEAAGSNLIEMKMTYHDNPASFFQDMNLRWEDTVYYEISMSDPERGAEIGYAVDQYSTWRIYEIKGYDHDYLLASEGESGAFRVMTSHVPEAPWRQYFLENATEQQRSERLLAVTLNSDGTAFLATPPISDRVLIPPYYYTFSEDQLIIYYEGGEVIASFTVIDENTLAFDESPTPLHADIGARYVTAHGEKSNKHFTIL
jgi:beta-lactamase regulating signal transducer with metallopeptidase domain